MIRVRAAAPWRRGVRQIFGKRCRRQAGSAGVPPACGRDARAPSTGHQTSVAHAWRGRRPTARVASAGWRAGLAAAVVLHGGLGVGAASPAVAATVEASPPEAAEDGPRRTVLVVGNSISAGYGFGLERGWVQLLRQRLGARHRVVNASVSGDTTTGGLARIDELLATHDPDIVIIELGGNDGLRGQPLAGIRANLRAMTDAVQEHGATPVLAGMRIHPNYGPRYADAFHGIYAAVADATGAALVPFLLEGVATDPTLMQRDGVHPNAAAQAKLLENAWEVLAPLMFNDAAPGASVGREAPLE